MDNGYKEILEGVSSRLDPLKAGLEAKAFIGVSSQMVYTLGRRTNRRPPAEQLRIDSMVRQLIVLANRFQVTSGSKNFDHQLFLVHAHEVYKRHLEIYNEVGFPEITISEFLATSTRIEKCLHLLSSHWANKEFMEEVHFFIETYAEMYYHHFKKSALEVTRSMRHGTRPGGAQ